MHYTIVYHNPKSLIPHEHIDDKKLQSVKKSVKQCGGIRHPVVIDRNTNVILDGHHRCRAYIELHMRNVPCIEVDYFDPSITLTFRRKEIGLQIIKSGIIDAAKHGKVFPHKTTKHYIPNRNHVKIK